MTTIVTPVGRIVQGSVHVLEPVTDPITKQPKFDKAGKQRNQCFFSVAVPKTKANWKEETWGQAIYQVAVGAFPNGQTNMPTFAWKVVDGDSTIPDKSNKRPCDKQGFPGNWILRFSGGFLPILANRDGSQRLDESQKIELGDYIQVEAKIAGNNSTQSPGVYLNFSSVAFTGHGERIVYERDVSQVGFGQAPLPAGVMAAPAAGIPVAAPAPVPAPTPAPAPAAPANPALLQPLPPAPPAAKQMTAAATATYEQYLAAGWTDAQLIQNGLMVG